MSAAILEVCKKGKKLRYNDIMEPSTSTRSMREGLVDAKYGSNLF